MVKSVFVRFDKLLHSTPRAHLVKIGEKEHWLPKKLCRKLTVNKKLGGNVRIPAFLYERMGYKVTEEVADVTVEHHIPEAIMAIKPIVDPELLK